MTTDIDLPIALRRARRSLGADASSPGQSPHSSHSQQTHTPKKQPKTIKRVRFSDPGPLLSTTAPSSTGLTPLVRRTTLTPRRSGGRRHSHPATSSSTEEEEQEVCVVTPLRQVLSGRVQRRIRRNGLSAEMNAIAAEGRARARAEREEVDRLRGEVAARDKEIARLREEGRERDDDETVVLDTERVWELEREVAELRGRLALRRSSSPAMDWTVAARDPFAEEYTCMDIDATGEDDVGVEEFGDSSLAGLACSTPTRRGGRGGMLATPPTTSPAAARSSPCAAAGMLSATTPRSHAGVQTDLPDAEKERMEEEMASLHLELAKVTTTLEGYAAFAERVAAQLGDLSSSSPESESTTPSPHSRIESQITTLLQTLSDRTAALLQLTSTVSALGFPGSDAEDILRSVTTAFRTARLELEYLTPGEIALPLSASGAAVLDLLLDRLRDLARRAREGDEQIDEYHALELSLRQQLSARVDVTDKLAREVKGLEEEIRERDARLGEQGVGLDRLKGAVASYARDVGELEALVARLEGEKGEAVGELEGRLGKLEGQIVGLEEGHAQALGEMRRAHKEEVAGLNRSHGSALALRDARVAELRGEIERVNASLRAAHETVRRLRVESERAKAESERLVEENKGLAEGVEAERRKAKEVVDGMRAELERVVRMSEGLLATPRKKKGAADRRDSALGDEDGEDEVDLVETPSTAGRRGSFLSGELAKRGGRKRRRYDSGLGFLDEEEVEA